MGFLRWIRRLFGLPTPSRPKPTAGSPPGRVRRDWRPARLRSFRRQAAAQPPRPPAPTVDRLPYSFARRTVAPGRLLGRPKAAYLDLSRDGSPQALASRNLPPLATPDDLAAWLGLPVGKLAWLAGRLDVARRPASTRQSHYVYRWKPKRSGGVRLIESPKPLLRGVQTRILRDILDRVPPHPAAHGFARGRSILTNATPHCGRAVVVKWDLKDFYATVRFNRVVAIYRSLGYSREAALWLAGLTTAAVPADLPLPESGAHALQPYRGRHLPQGAASSPALANLSAFPLDVRLAGLAEAFGGTYTRYADDLTISGDDRFARGLRNLIPLSEQAIRSERFRLQPAKRRVLRRGRRQTVAGVVVNDKPNVSRDEFDRLKAILHNAARYGAASQNRAGHPAFAEHLRGRIAHVAMLSPARGAKLAKLYDRIDFR